MNKITRKEMVEVTKTIYVASDGTECPTEQSCRNYEERLNERLIRDEVSKVPHTVCAACAVEFADDSDYRSVIVFKPRDQFDIFKINQWLKINDGSDCVVSTTTDAQKYIDGGWCFLIYDDSYVREDQIGERVYITCNLGTIAEWKRSYETAIDSIVSRIGRG